MSASVPYRSILVVDPDSFPDLGQGVIHCKTGKEALDAISSPSSAIAGIFVNPRVVSPNGLTVIRYAHQFKPGVPLFILYDTKLPPFTDHELNQLGVIEAIAKPVGLGELALRVVPLLWDPSWLAREGDPDGGGHSGDADFFAVRSDTFLSGAKSCFDVYVRLNAGKYVKVLAEGDSFTSERIASYLSKGVARFYLEKKSRDRFLGFCDGLMLTVIGNSQAPVEAKVLETLRYGEETLRFLRQEGLAREEHVQHAAKFVDQVHALVTQIDLKKNAVFKAFFNNIGACEHGAGTAIIAAIVSQSLKLGADDTPQVLGLAAYFHDIGLTQMAPELQDEDESQMTKEQIEQYRTHPVVGAQLLRAMPGIDSKVIDIVAHHHDRPNQERSFAISSGGLTPASEVIGIGDEFMRMIAKCKANPGRKPLQAMELNVFRHFSKPTVDAFRSAFFLTLL